jgi:hypothetical protein
MSKIFFRFHIITVTKKELFGTKKRCPRAGGDILQAFNLAEWLQKKKRVDCYSPLIGVYSPKGDDAADTAEPGEEQPDGLLEPFGMPVTAITVKVGRDIVRWHRALSALTAFPTLEVL